MSTNYLHERKDFSGLLRLLEQETGIFAYLIEKDYYFLHKAERFPKKDYDTPIQENEAFLLRSEEKRERFRQRYMATKALYYREQPDFEILLERINQYIGRL